MCMKFDSGLPAAEIGLLVGGEGVDGETQGRQLDPADLVVDLRGHLVDPLDQLVLMPDQPLQGQGLHGEQVGGIEG